MEPGSRTYLMKQTGFLSVASFLFPHPHLEFPVIIYSCSCGSEARCSRTVDLRAILRRFVPPPFNTTGAVIGKVFHSIVLQGSYEMS
jgi:hypothetical protein